MHSIHRFFVKMLLSWYIAPWSHPLGRIDASTKLGLSAITAVVLPKIHSGQDLHDVSRAIHRLSDKVRRVEPLRIIPSIESAKAIWNLRDIASWKSDYDPKLGGILSALLVRIIFGEKHDSHIILFVISLPPKTVSFMTCSMLCFSLIFSDRLCRYIHYSLTKPTRTAIYTISNSDCSKGFLSGGN
jgi:hypothetical protein